MKRDATAAGDAALPPEATDDDAPVLNAGGEFDIRDAAVDLRRYRIEDWIALALFWTLGLTVFYQFFTRYALNDSAAWTEEIARYLLVATVFIGAAVCVRKNNHIQVDFLYRLLPKRPMRLMATLVDLLRIVFFATCAVLTVLLMDRIGRSRMAVVELPMGIVYAAVLLGFALMTWRAVGVAVANWKRGASVLEQPELADDPSHGEPQRTKGAA